ncbi:ABC transporter permease, partial [Yersinia pestis]|uniref:ABC transporter permease subunit n=1 Tax=Yersinia pestis TaxID=632 RepID=UPI001E0A74BA|nr:ABC transporter permease [Yersinia pestis]
NLTEGYIWIGQATIGGWPLMPVLFLLVLAVMGALLKNTLLGRSIYADGGNPVASNSAGISVARVKIIAYKISAFIATLAGFLMA